MILIDKNFNTLHCGQYSLFTNKVRDEALLLIEKEIKIKRNPDNNIIICVITNDSDRSSDSGLCPVFNDIINNFESITLVEDFLVGMLLLSNESVMYYFIKKEVLTDQEFSFLINH
jgi:hypothetical protein